MRQLRSPFLLAALVALLALVVVGCGGDGGVGEVPSDAVAVVGGETISKAQFDTVLGQARRGYVQQKRPFPKAGSAEYEQLKRQILQFLVQRSQFAQKAEELDVSVSEKQVADRLKQVKQQYFRGDEARYREQLEQQGLTEAQLRTDLEAQLLSEEIFKKVTAEVKVTDADVSKYYQSHLQQYRQPESRTVRHILVKQRGLAQRLYRQLQAGASFARLAKKHSQDPGSKGQGGRLEIAKGQTVPPFDQTAFMLGQGKLSSPVKTQYGYHIIQPISAVRPAKVTPLAQVKASIRQQLLQTKRNQAMSTWVADTRKDFEDETAYQTGYSPPQTGTTTTATGAAG